MGGGEHMLLVCVQGCCSASLNVVGAAKNCFAPNVNSAKVKKPCYRQIVFLGVSYEYQYIRLSFTNSGVSVTHPNL